MKICLLGEYSGNLDEGMKKVASHFAEELSKEHRVLTLDLRGAFTKVFWKDIKNFESEIIHYIPGPSLKSFILLKIISLYCRDAKTIMSAMHPHVTRLSELFIPFVKPDLILSQSHKTEIMFKKLGCKTEFLPCGVDIRKFTPATIRSKEELREKYGIEKEMFVILHIGSIKEGRNVPLTEKLQKGNHQVIIVGAISTGIEKKVVQQLKKSGCLVWKKYFKNIEEIYALSDCYVFPTPPVNKLNSIEMPLSVLEAMSCNLPVISTKFGALTRVFKEGDGLIFVEGEEQFVSSLEEIKSGINVKTREKVLSYSWENIVRELESIYGHLYGLKSTISSREVR
jgi:glycosyltransferase involved in cell wall biosynthesis